MNGRTLGLGRHLFFLRHPLSTTAATATIFLVAVRGVVFILFIRSTLVTLNEAYLESEQERRPTKTYIVLILYNLNI